jgi:hypothetical protein
MTNVQAYTLYRWRVINDVLKAIVVVALVTAVGGRTTAFDSIGQYCYNGTDFHGANPIFGCQPVASLDRELRLREALA